MVDRLDKRCAKLRNSAQPPKTAGTAHLPDCPTHCRLYETRIREVLLVR